LLAIAEKFLPTSFETYFNDIEGLLTFWQYHVGKPIVNIQLVAPTGATSAIIITTWGGLASIG
jgi:hypothetical protein